MIIKYADVLIMCLIFLIIHINLVIFNFINQYLILTSIRSLLKNNINYYDFYLKISVIEKKFMK